MVTAGVRVRSLRTELMLDPKGNFRRDGGASFLHSVPTKFATPSLTVLSSHHITQPMNCRPTCDRTAW